MSRPSPGKTKPVKHRRSTAKAGTAKSAAKARAKGDKKKAKTNAKAKTKKAKGTKKRSKSDTKTPPSSRIPTPSASPRAPNFSNFDLLAQARAHQVQANAYTQAHALKYSQGQDFSQYNMPNQAPGFELAAQQQRVMMMAPMSLGNLRRGASSAMNMAPGANQHQMMMHQQQMNALIPLIATARSRAEAEQMVASIASRAYSAFHGNKSN